MGHESKALVEKISFKHKRISIDTFLYEGKINVDHKYFIKEINKGIKNSQYNYKTYVGSQMTDWNFFDVDQKMQKVFKTLAPALDECNIPFSRLVASWGLKYHLGDYAREHHHKPSTWSGILYLSNGGARTYFSNYDIYITPEIGKFVLFSSELLHGTETNKSKTHRYAISFNFQEQPRFSNTKESFKGRV